MNKISFDDAPKIANGELKQFLILVWNKYSTNLLQTP